MTRTAIQFFVLMIAASILLSADSASAFATGEKVNPHCAKVNVEVERHSNACVLPDCKIGEDNDDEQESPGLMLADKYYGAGCDWKLADRGDGYFSLENQHFGGSYLDVDGNNCSLMLADKYYGAGCNWKLVDRGDGYFSFENQHFEGFYLDVMDERRGLRLADKYDGAGCHWKKISRGDGIYSFVNRQMQGCFLDVDGRFQQRAEPIERDDSNRDEMEEAIRQKYDGRVIFGNSYEALDAAPFALDAWMFGGYLSSEWAMRELPKLGIDAASFLEELDFDPSREELIGDYMAFQIRDAREEQHFNKFVPYIAIQSKDSDAPKRSAFRIVSIDHPDYFLSHAGPAREGMTQRNVALVASGDSDAPRSTWILHELEEGIFEIENAVNRSWFLGQADQPRDGTESLNVQILEGDDADSPHTKWLLRHIDHGMYLIENADHRGMFLSHPSAESPNPETLNVTIATEDDPEWNRSIWMLVAVED